MRRRKRKTDPKANPSAIRRTAAQEKRLKATYGIDEDEYQRMLKAQGGVCAICQRYQRRCRLAVDHSHASGKVRGLLCLMCNRGLGRFFDSPQRLRRAAEYLERAGG